MKVDIFMLESISISGKHGYRINFHNIFPCKNILNAK